MAQVYIGLGANLGHRLQNIGQALHLLKNNPDIKIIRVSSIYETEPLGVGDQPLFLNAAAEIETDLKPQKLLKFMQEVETALGRIRETPHAPREIDLDLLLYDDLIISTDILVVPHPLIAERAFVLVPLNEIAAEFIHPVYKISLGRMCAGVKGQEKVSTYQAEDCPPQ